MSYQVYIYLCKLSFFQVWKLFPKFLRRFAQRQGNTWSLRLLIQIIVPKQEVIWHLWSSLSTFSLWVLMMDVLSKLNIVNKTFQKSDSDLSTALSALKSVRNQLNKLCEKYTIKYIANLVCPNRLTSSSKLMMKILFLPKGKELSPRGSTIRLWRKDFHAITRRLITWKNCVR